MGRREGVEYRMRLNWRIRGDFMRVVSDVNM